MSVSESRKYLLIEFGDQTSSDRFTDEYRHDKSNPESIVADYYSDKGYEVVGIDSSVQTGALQADDTLPGVLQEELIQFLEETYSLGPLYSAMPLSAFERDGKPDFFIYREDPNENYRYWFVEVKSAGDGLRESQLNWAATFEQIPYKLIYVVENKD